MAFPIGGLVRITGLVSKSEYNGKLATVAQFSATTGRIIRANEEVDASKRQPDTKCETDDAATTMA